LEEWVMKRTRILSLLSACVIALASLSIAAGSQGLWYGDNPLVVTDKSVYVVGETVKVNVTCYIPMQFTSGKQCYFVVEDPQDNIVYNMSRHFYWIQVFTFLSPPKTFSFVWDQKNDTGVQVPAGSYEIWGYEAGYRMSDPPIAGNSTNISIAEDTSSQSVEVRYLSLVQGWNLVSLPLLASNYTASNLGLPSGSVVANFNTNTHSYDVFIVGFSPPASSFPLVDFRGYFIYAALACTIPIFGELVTTTHYIELNAGWNLVGFPETSSGRILHASEIPGWIIIPPPVIIVSTYDSATHSYRTWLPSIPTMNNFVLIPGAAYAVYVSVGVTIAYGP
jgi:hypothetical protein